MGLVLRGEDGTRTHNFLLAKQALYQLSYIPVSGRGGADQQRPRVSRLVILFYHLLRKARDSNPQPLITATAFEAAC